LWHDIQVVGQGNLISRQRLEERSKMNYRESRQKPSERFSRTYDAIFKWATMMAANWTGIYLVLRLLKFA
jgi:hypothetical protein